MHNLPDSILLLDCDTVMFSAQIDMNSMFNHEFPQVRIRTAFQHARAGILASDRTDNWKVPLHNDELRICIGLKRLLQPG